MICLVLCYAQLQPSRASGGQQKTVATEASVQRNKVTVPFPLLYLIFEDTAAFSDRNEQVAASMTAWNTGSLPVTHGASNDVLPVAKHSIVDVLEQVYYDQLGFASQAASETIL